MSKITISNTNEFKIYIRNKLKKDYPLACKEKIDILVDFAVESFLMGANMAGGKLSVNID